MFQSVLIEMRRRVRAGRMTLAIHAREEMYNDHLTTDDLENGILRGSIVERQWDERWREWKYVVAGASLDGRSITAVFRCVRPECGEHTASRGTRWYLVPAGTGQDTILSHGIGRVARI